MLFRSVRALLQLADSHLKDSEAVQLWATLVHMIASVPKRDDEVREMVLAHDFLPRAVALVADECMSLDAKCVLFDAMNAVLSLGALPRKVLMEQIPQLITVVLRLKRELQSPRHRAAAEAQQFARAAEKARDVLEKLGHTEGRGGRRFRVYAMALVATGVLVGSAINWFRQ